MCANGTNLATVSIKNAVGINILKNYVKTMHVILSIVSSDIPKAANNTETMASVNLIPVCIYMITNMMIRLKMT